MFHKEKIIMSEKTESPSKEFIVLMAALMSIVALSIDALLPALGFVGEDLRITHPNHAQYLIGFIFIGMAAGQLVAGPCSDAFGRKRVLYAGIGLFLIGSVISYFADSLVPMLIGRFIQGIGVSGPYVSAVSIVRDKYAGRTMARVMSIIMMIFIMVPAIAPSVGEAIMFFASWRYIFVLYIVYATAVGLWIFLRLEETLPSARRIPLSPHNIWHGFKEVVGNKVTLSYTVCMGIIFGSFMGYLNSSQQIFQVQFGAGKMFAVYFGVLALVLGFASLMNSRFVEKLGMAYICQRAVASITVASALFLALHAVVHIELWMFLAYAVVMFFSFGLVFGNFNALAMEPMGHIAGIASAVIGAMSSVISMTLGAGIGQMYNNTLVPIVTGFLVLGVLCLVVMRAAEKIRHPERG